MRPESTLAVSRRRGDGSLGALPRLGLAPRFERGWRHLFRAGAAALAGCGSLACGSVGEPAESGERVGHASQAIIGGALDESTSGVVGLALDLGTRVAGHCSGTLIAPNLVLTARHCVAFTENTDEAGIVECETAQFRNPFPARMLLVSPDPVRPTDPGDPSYVRGREVRTVGDDDVCGSDIALIILDDLVAPEAAPIAPRLQVAPVNSEHFSTVGYGLTSVDDPSSDGTRQRADGSAVRCSGEACVSLSGGSIRASEWASVDAPICSGDSGGPALDEQGRVFGVASRGDPNCEIAVYGDVSNWAPFIVDTALSAALIGGYDAPDWADEAVLDSGNLANVEGDRGGCSIAAGGRVSGSPGGCAPPGLSSLGALVLVCAGWLVRRTRSPKTTPRA
jgi:hypothetical protein